MNRFCVFVILGIVLYIKGCHGLKCYVCQFPGTTGCGDEFLLTNQDVAECTQGTCFKKRGFIEDDSKVSRLQVIRGCVTLAETDCYDNNNDFGFNGRKCMCNSDYCNKSPSEQCFTVMTFLLTVFACIVNTLIKLKG